jgi:hypothetical protein
MLLYKYRLHLVMVLFSIFTAKLLVSAMPVCISQDRTNVKSFALELDQEHGTEGEAKELLKQLDYRIADVHCHYHYLPLLQEYGIRNSFIDHSKRYVDPYHPAVPTPPPNCN